MRLSSELIINLNNLDHNFNQLKQIAVSNEVIFMVKGNAYGHGILEVSNFACNELGVKRLGCASLGEALYIRQNLSNLDCELWVFSDLNLKSKVGIENYRKENILPVISNLNDLNYFLKEDEFNKLPLILKIDTGMHRLGIVESELEKTCKLIKDSGRKSIHHLMTHFSSSYIKIKSNDRTEMQYQRFRKTMDFFKDQAVAIEETSVSNSGAIEQKFGLEESHIRPGLMLYGPKSCFHHSILWKGKNLSSLKTEIIKIKAVQKGTPVGYGAHIVGEDGFMVFLPIGYADGVLTYYSGKKFISHGEETKILGRVNMDMTTLYYKSLPEGLDIGSKFDFWKESDDLAQLAYGFGTTPYQLLTAITTRIPKIYLSAK